MFESDELVESLGALRGHDICHIGYVVPKMERSLAQWIQVGAQIIIPPTADPIQRVSCALISFAGALPIELVAPLGDASESPVGQRLKRGGGMDHVCLFTDDMDRDIATYVTGGALLVVEPVYGCVFNRTIAFLQLRTGLVLELMTRRPGTDGEAQPPASGRSQV